MSAGAVSPIPEPSACRSIAARTGCIFPTSIRSRGSRLAAGLRFTRRRRGRSCASESATRAKARWRIILRRWCARTAPSRMRRVAKPMSPACRRCPRTWATGGPLWNLCSGRLPAARLWMKSPQWIFHARWSAMPMRIAGRVTARCSQSSRASCRCSSAWQRSACFRRAIRSRSTRRAAASWRVPPSLRYRLACWAQTGSNSIRRCRRASATRSPSFRSVRTSMSRLS